MKKIIAALAVVVAAAAMASSAGATGIVYEDRGFECGILTPAGFVTTFDSSFVIYSSGKAVLKCTAHTDYNGPRVVTSPNNTDLNCGYFSFSTGSIDLPFWKGVHGSNGQSVLTCNGHVNLNAQPAPTARAAGGGAAGN